MLEIFAMVALLVFIMGVGVLSLDHLRGWSLRLANDLIDLRQKWELSQLELERKRLELDQKFNTYNES